MSCHVDLMEGARFFRLGSKLVYAYAGLEKLLKGEKPNEDEKENLQYAGSLIDQLDHDSGREGNAVPLTMATSMRPSFYEALMVYAGFFKQDKAVAKDYLNRLHDVLSSSGERASLSREELEVARGLIKQLSDYALREYDKCR